MRLCLGSAFLSCLLIIWTIKRICLAHYDDEPETEAAPVEVHEKNSFRRISSTHSFPDYTASPIPELRVSTSPDVVRPEHPDRTCSAEQLHPQYQQTRQSAPRGPRIPHHIARTMRNDAILAPAPASRMHSRTSSQEYLLEKKLELATQLGHGRPSPSAKRSSYARQVTQ